MQWTTIKKKKCCNMDNNCHLCFHFPVITLSKSMLAWLEFNSMDVRTFFMVMLHHSSCGAWQGLQAAASRIISDILLPYPLQEQRASPPPIYPPLFVSSISKVNSPTDAVLLHIFIQITHFKTSCGAEPVSSFRQANLTKTTILEMLKINVIDAARFLAVKRLFL